MNYRATCSEPWTDTGGGVPACMGTLNSAEPAWQMSTQEGTALLGAIVLVLVTAWGGRQIIRVLL